VAKKSLVERAKKMVVVINRSISNQSSEEIELALAWLDDEVTLTQMSKVMEYKSAAAYTYRVAKLLKEAYKAGLLVRK
jgi:hypothetical protein